MEDTQSLQRKNVSRGDNYLVREVWLGKSIYQELEPSHLHIQTRTRLPAGDTGTVLKRSNKTLVFIVSHWVFFGMTQETMT